MVVAQVELFTASGRGFAVLRIVKTATGAVVRVLYPDGRTIESPLYRGVNGVYVGTTLFDVIVSQNGRNVRILRVFGTVRMGLPMPYRVRHTVDTRSKGTAIRVESGKLVVRWDDGLSGRMADWSWVRDDK